MKAKHLVRYEEWQQGGRWYCNDTNDLTGLGCKWYTPARLLNMPLVDFVKMLIDKFQVDYISFPNQDILIYSWKSQAKMRVFKNWLNKEMRRVQGCVQEI